MTTDMREKKDPMISVLKLDLNSEQFAQLSAEVLRAGFSIRFRATGDSMRPLIREGDRVLVKPIAASKIKAGDVVLAEMDTGRAVMHRVIRVEQGAFTLQADQSQQPDGVLPEASILGRLESLHRNGAEIHLDGFRMRLLGKMIAWNARSHINNNIFKKNMIKCIKRFPGLRRYFNTEVPLEQ